jgi:hypothetical protein
MVRWNPAPGTGTASAGTVPPLLVSSNRRFRVTGATTATWLRQVSRLYAGGGYLPQSSRLTLDGSDVDWGGAAGELAQIGDGVAGEGDPRFYNAATDEVPSDQFQIVAKPTGSGDGEIASNVGKIRCVLSGGAVSGTCSDYFNAGTGITMAASASAGSVLEGWNTQNCIPYNSPPRGCDLGRPAGGQTIEVGAQFVKL